MRIQSSIPDAETIRARAVVCAILTYLSALPMPAQQNQNQNQQKQQSQQTGPTVNLNLPNPKPSPTVNLNLPNPTPTPTPTPVTITTVTPTITQTGSTTGTLSNPSIQLVQPQMTMAPSFWMPSMAPMGPGTLVCSDLSGLGKCGTTDADFVGNYTYHADLKCSSGFFDPIYGGTCWKCPDDDGSGAWVRSANKVTDDNACWRDPKETFASATFHGNNWAWNCSSGQFWDGNGQSGSPVLGGACWSCPADHPRRTGHPVTASNACTTSANQTAPATLVSYLNCPTPDPVGMYPGKLITDHRLPGQPFLDVASGAYIKPSNSAGACWACPAVDSDGNFVVAERNGSGLTSGKTGADQVSSKYTTNNGCTIKQKYKPPAFPEPGLSGLAGVKELLFEKQILIRPNDLTTYLNAVATKNNVPKPQNWVAAQWTDIAQHPYANNQIRALVLQYMKRKAPAYMYPNGQVPTSATAAETTLINSFQAYTQARKTYTAQQVLNMYDAWNTFQQEYSPIQSQLSQFFSYGVVPPDLKSMASGLVGLTGAAVGAFASGAMAANILTATESASTAYSNTARSAEIAVAISKIAQNMAIVEEGAAASSEATVTGAEVALTVAASALAGATAIAVVGLILTVVASDQLNQITTMRPDLQGAVTAAQQPVVFSSLDPGLQQYFWALGTGVATEREDAQVLAMAYAACRAVQSNCGQTRGQPGGVNPLHPNN